MPLRKLACLQTRKHINCGVIDALTYTTLLAELMNCHIPPLAQLIHFGLPPLAGPIHSDFLNFFFGTFQWFHNVYRHFTLYVHVWGRP